MSKSSSVMDQPSRVISLSSESELSAESRPVTGFTPYAERLNGRLAMVGFMVLLAVQVLAQHGWLPGFSG